MASGSGCSYQPKDLRWSDDSCTTDDSRNVTDFATSTSASVVDFVISSTSYFSAVEEQIDGSKAHWSTLADDSGYTDEEKLDFEVSNLQEFKALQKHPIWGSFFMNFPGDGISTGFNCEDLGELVVDKKFAQGGQAELYEAQIKWKDLWNTEMDQRYNLHHVLKVFKEGTLLEQLKSQLPEALMLYHVHAMERIETGSTRDYPEYVSRINCGILLKGGKFAFLLNRLHFDMRTLIERNMKFNSGEECGPFSKEEAGLIMYHVALGVNSLHNRDTVHRDLKASNVLVLEDENSSCSKWRCYVADFECSIGVVGTHFFRAPEILQVCKERKVNKSPEVFSKAADVYSYGMTCYEILTGKLPFEDHPLKDDCSLLMNLVINQYLRPEVPEYVEDWARELLGRCWQLDPTTRPRIGEILDVLSTNSTKARGFEVYLKERYGENFRN